MNHLTHLTLFIDSEGSKSVDEVISAIADSDSDDTDGSICPSLTHLDLPKGILSAVPCVKLVRSRNKEEESDNERRRTAKLQYLTMELCPDLDADMRRFLKAKVPCFSAKPYRQFRFGLQRR